MADSSDALKVDLHDLVVALSEALGLVGGKIINHGKRVAYLALSLSEPFQLSPTEFDDLRTAALLHDAGVSKTKTHEKLLSLDWEGALEHCRDGAALLQDFTRFHRVAEVILHHHTKWADMHSANLDPRTALLANLIFIADRIDVQVNWDTEIILNREKIENQIGLMSGSFFNPDLVKVFKRKSQVEVFWLSLYPRHLANALDRYKPARPLELGLEEMARLAAIFAKIVDNKSPYTRDHSYGVGRLCRMFARRLKLPDLAIKKLHIAGLVHDLGKLAIPDEILEKPATLTAEEFQVVKRHPFETYYILSGLPALAEIRDWASYHHERTDGSGYPFHLTAESYHVEHVIVMLSDIIQALIQNRPYRSGLSRHQVLDILNHLTVHQPIFESLMRIVRREYDYVAAVARGEESPE
ncbi:MAG: HD domain-containing phosphohydrolase [Thermodesulfobacteriota bacterium]